MSTPTLTAAAIQCTSWCDQGAGHTDEKFAEDQTCITNLPYAADQPVVTLTQRPDETSPLVYVELGAISFELAGADAANIARRITEALARVSP